MGRGFVPVRQQPYRHRQELAQPNHINQVTHIDHFALNHAQLHTLIQTHPPNPSILSTRLELHQLPDGHRLRRAQPQHYQFQYKLAEEPEIQYLCIRCTHHGYLAVCGQGAQRHGYQDLVLFVG